MGRPAGGEHVRSPRCAARFLSAALREEGAIRYKMGGLERFLGLMGRFRSGVGMAPAAAVLLVVVPLAVPSVQAVASAAKTTTTFSISTSPVSVHGYGMSLFVTETDGAKTASLTVTFSITGTTARHPTQTHSYSFSLPAGALDVAAGLAGASVDTGTGMAKQGAIAMALKKLGDIQVARDACGTTKTRTGTLKGAFKLVADTAFFHTVKESALPATLTKRVATPGCGQTSSPCTPGTTLSASNSKRHMFLNATRTPVPTGGATVSEFLSYVQSPTATAPATISHLIKVSGAPKKALSPSADLTSAALNGSVGKPYLTGGVAFSGTPTSGACSKTLNRTISTGTVTGKLVAHFDSVGDRGFTAGKKVPATLIQTG